MGLVSPSQNNAGDTIEASDINNPVNQLAAVINGNIDATNIADNSITTSKLSSAAVTAAKLGFTTTTLTNTGTAGGTMYYINLGGIKLLWGTTASQSSGNPGNQFTVIFPASFFTTIQSAVITPSSMTSVIQQQANISGVNSTLMTIYFITTTAATQQVNFFVIGT